MGHCSSQDNAQNTIREPRTGQAASGVYGPQIRSEKPKGGILPARGSLIRRDDLVRSGRVAVAISRAMRSPLGAAALLAKIILG